MRFTQPRARSRRLFAALLAAALLPACAPPGDAIVSQCEGSALSVADDWRCTVKADRFERATSVTFTIESSRTRATVDAQLAVAAGTARVTIDQLPGSSWTVTAGTPLALSSVDVPIGQTKRLTLTVTPSSGVVEGLSGTVNYKTP